MCTDDDIDLAVGQACARLCHIFGRYQTRQLAHNHRQILEARSKSLHVLARQKRGRCDNRHLPAGNCGNKRRTQGNLRFAETDIATNQPVHRLAACQIIHHSFNGRKLIFGFLKGETGAKFFVKIVADKQFFAFAHGARRGRLDQLFGDNIQFFLEFCLAHLPCAAADFVKRHAHIIAAETTEQFNIFYRQKQPRIRVIDEFQAIMRRAVDVDGLQAFKSANTMLNMHHMIAD